MELSTAPQGARRSKIWNTQLQAKKGFRRSVSRSGRSVASLMPGICQFGCCCPRGFHQQQIGSKACLDIPIFTAGLTDPMSCRHPLLRVHFEMAYLAYWLPSKQAFLNEIQGHEACFTGSVDRVGVCDPHLIWIHPYMT